MPTLLFHALAEPSDDGPLFEAVVNGVLVRASSLSLILDIRQLWEPCSETCPEWERAMVAA